MTKKQMIWDDIKDWLEVGGILLGALVFMVLALGPLFAK